jgi:predicted PurR-regulated permease PerM
MSFPPPTPKQARVIWAGITALAAAVIVAFIVGTIWGLGQVLSLLSPVLWPLAVAGVLAYLLDPLVDFIERRGVPRTRSILCVFALAAVIVLALFGSVVPQVVRETRQLAQTIPRYAARVQHQVQDWINNPPQVLQRFLRIPADSGATSNAPILPDTDAPSTNAPVSSTPGPTAPAGRSTGIDAETLQSATASLARALPKIGAWLVGQASKVASWFGVLAGLSLIPVYAFYFLLEKEGIQQRWSDYLPVTKSEFKDELVFVLKSINDYLIAFFRGQVIVALCDGVLYTIGFFIVGLPYAFLLGVMATVLTMIPFLGAITTCATALVIAFVQFGGWLHPLGVLAVFGVVQTLEGLVISPKIMGDRVGLHPLAIIIAVMAGTTLLGGLLGGILAIPLTAALRVLMFRYVWKKRET